MRDVLPDNINIGTVRGRKSRYENAVNVRETAIRIGTFIDEPDQENRNRWPPPTLEPTEFFNLCRVDTPAAALPCGRWVGGEPSK